MIPPPAAVNVKVSEGQGHYGRRLDTDDPVTAAAVSVQSRVVGT